MKLTKTTVDGLEFSQQGQPVYWDDTLPGFGVRVSQTVKTYIAQGRVNSKDRRVSLGRHGVITCDKARKKAVKALNDMNGGIEPVAVKKGEKALSVTLEQATEEYIKDRNMKPANVNDINKHLGTTFKAWKKKPIAEITRDMVLS
ncbi:MAG: integrase arm-type DNA-binding domain-containing protein, partial [Desulfatiglandaceae bacterium]